MGGGRDASGALIYRRVNGVYVRRDGKPINRNKTDKQHEKFIKEYVEKARKTSQLLGVEFDFDEKKAIENAERAWKRKQGTLTFSEKIDDATTEDLLLNVLREKYPNVKEDFVKNKDINSIKKIVKTIDALEERYPFMRGFITTLGVKNKGAANIDWSGTEFNISSEYLARSNAKEINGLNQKERGWFPPNYTIESVAAHEFGHALHIKYFYKLLIEAGNIQDENKRNRTISRLMTQQGTGTYLNGIERKVMKKIGAKTKQDAWKQVSGYASATKPGKVNVFEVIAESFGDVFTNGENASDASKAYVEALLKELG